MESNINIFKMSIEDYLDLEGFIRINHEFIFSKDLDMSLDESKDLAFYISNTNTGDFLYKINKNDSFNNEDVINYITENNLIFIGYLASGDIDDLNNNLISINRNNDSDNGDASNTFVNANGNRVKQGSLDNIQEMLIKALKLLAEELGTSFNKELLPVKLYIVGQAALEYWNYNTAMSEDFQNGLTFDIDVLKAEPNNLFDLKKFQDAIYLIDRKIHQMYEYNNDEIIINNDSKMHDFPFEISFTREIIDENSLIIYIGDEEGIILNKIYACFESILSGAAARYKDLNFSQNWLSRMNIYSKEELFNKYPPFNDIPEINSTWENIFM